MQVSPAVPPVAVQSEVLSTSVCSDFPESTIHGVTFCVVGLHIAGATQILANAAKQLAVEGWKLVKKQLGPDHKSMILNTKGRSLPEIEALHGRINNGEYGAVQSIGISVPMVHQTK